jgi:GNAT superfamily N-acetyltransferase
MTQKEEYNIRAAKPDEAGEIYYLIQQLAEYEQLSHQMISTTELIQKYGFDKKKYFHTLLVENLGKGLPRFIGFALYFFTFSTFLGRPSLYLEDLFVLPAFRGRGIGKALLTELARIAQKEGCGRMEWAVLDWNEPAIKFYQELGAIPLDEWKIFRLNSSQIENLIVRNK